MVTPPAPLPPDLPCALSWLDEPPATADGRRVIFTGPYFASSVADARWLDDGARLVWTVSIAARGLAGDGRVSEDAQAFFVASARTLEPSAVLLTSRYRAWTVAASGAWLVGAMGYFDEGGEFRSPRGYCECELQVWDLRTGHLVRTIDLGQIVPGSVEVAGDDAVIVGGTVGHSAYSYGNIVDAARLVDLRAGSVREVGVPAPETGSCGADRSLDLERSDANAVSVVLRARGQEQARYPVLEPRSLSVRFSPDGAHLVVHVADGQGLLWDVARREIVARWTGGARAFTAAGDVLSVEDRRGEVGIAWGEGRRAEDLRVAGAMNELHRHLLEGVLVDTPEGTLELWDPLERAPVAAIRGVGHVHAASLRARALVVGTADAQRVLVTPRGRFSLSNAGADFFQRSVFSDDGATIFRTTAGEPQYVVAHRVEDGAQLWRRVVPGFYPSLGTLACSAARGVVSVAAHAPPRAVVVLLRARDGAPLATLPLGGSHLTSEPMAFCPDGTRLAIAHPGGRVQLLDLPPG